MNDPSPHAARPARPDEQAWTEPAALGWADAFRADPCPGGPPLVSADGHWWWTGELWQRRLPEPA